MTIKKYPGNAEFNIFFRRVTMIKNDVESLKKLIIKRRKILSVHSNDSDSMSEINFRFHEILDMWRLTIAQIDIEGIISIGLKRMLKNVDKTGHHLPSPGTNEPL